MSERLRSQFPASKGYLFTDDFEDVTQDGATLVASIREIDGNGDFVYVYKLYIAPEQRGNVEVNGQLPTNTTVLPTQEKTPIPPPDSDAHSDPLKPSASTKSTFATYVKPALTLAGVVALTAGAYYYGAMSSNTASVVESFSPSDSSAGGFASALSSVFGRSDAPSKSVIPESAASSVGGWASRLGWGSSKSDV